ncbi:swarming motility YbiA-like protein [Rhizobium phage RHph_N28_1]|nr:swarming motility YbiA-like protein [Rhizobium phage RHph_N28_1]QIG74101.1 swarming motility YbiA-like protein [Rhizobium phage RHph_N42]QIG74707.1 swarming motility YbiA-like protein [Rhizobium phage RHph_I42]
MTKLRTEWDLVKCAYTAYAPIAGFDGEWHFLSNFYASPIIYEGILYPTVEHAFQAAKTLNMKVRKQISLLATPGQAKAAGRAVKLRPDWEDIKIDIMRELIILKFKIPALRKYLLLTKGITLIEANTWGDKFWGTNMRGIGRNELGKLLWEHCDQLQRERFIKRLSKRAA